MILKKLSKEYSEFGHFHIAYMKLLIAKKMTTEAINYIKKRFRFSICLTQHTVLGFLL